MYTIKFINNMCIIYTSMYIYKLYIIHISKLMYCLIQILEKIYFFLIKFVLF
jgi:hypothetical protein